MPITSINRVRTITLPLTSATGSAIVPIYQNSGLVVGQELITSYVIISFNCFLKNLKVFASIQSLPEIPLPDFKVEDSETDKLYKTLDIEWKSPRKQLSLYIASEGQGWSQVGSVSLLNPYGYPFRIYNLMDLYTDNLALELGENSRIGIGIDDVGYDYLMSNDIVTVHGSYLEEIFVSYADITPQITLPPINIELPPPQATPVTIDITSIPIDLHLTFAGSCSILEPADSETIPNDDLSNSSLVGN